MPIFYVFHLFPRATSLIYIGESWVMFVFEFGVVDSHLVRVVYSTEHSTGEWQPTDKEDDSILMINYHRST